MTGHSDGLTTEARTANKQAAISLTPTPTDDSSAKAEAKSEAKAETTAGNSDNPVHSKT